MREQFVFYRSFFEAAQKLTDKTDRLALLEAICNYALDEIEPTFDSESILSLCWTLVEPNLKVANKRAKAGRKGGQTSRGGGAPKGNKNASKLENQQANNKQTTSKQQAIKQTTSYNIKEELSINPTNVVLTSNSEIGGGGGSAREEFFRPPENFAQIAANDPEAVKAIFADQLWVEQACMRHAESTFSLAEKYKAFVANCITRGELYHIDIKRIKQHFDNWLNTKKYYDERAKRATASSNGQPATREEREQQIIDYHRAKWGSQSII